MTLAVPRSETLDLSGIPHELTQWSQWLGWRPEQRGDKLTKIPINLRTSRLASVTTPATWATIDEAQNCVGIAGVGFVLTREDPYCVIDLDQCIDPETNEVEPWALKIVDQLDSYTEISPSGRGLHIWIKGTLPPGRRRTEQIEIYDCDRYLTCTGNHLFSTPETIEHRQDELNTLHAHLFPKTEPTRRKPHQNAELHLDMADSEIIERARQAANGSKFERLMAGDMSDYPRKNGNGYDHSAADQALCNITSYWTRDERQIDRIFRSSGLMREKWDSRRGQSTYGEQTIANALAFVTEYYTPKAEKPHVDANLQDDMADTTASSTRELITRITALEQHVDRLQAELTQERERRLQAERDLKDSRYRRHLEHRVLRNKALKAERQTIVALGGEIHAAVTDGRVPENEPVPIYLDAIAANSGKSAQSVSANLRSLEERGLLKRHYRQEMKREVDQDGVIIREYPKTQLLVEISKPVPQWLSECAAYEPESEDKSWGGNRVVCSKHPYAGVIVTTTAECAICGEILHRDVKHTKSYTPPHQDDMAGDETPPHRKTTSKRGLRSLGDSFHGLDSDRINSGYPFDYCRSCDRVLPNAEARARGYCSTCLSEGVSA